MPKLPTRESLGALPQARSGRSLTSIKVVIPRGGWGSIIESGVKGLASGIASVGLAAEHIEDYDRKREAFETERAFQEFEWNRKIDLDQSMRTMEPGQAGDFAERETQSYIESAKEFYKNVPEYIKPVYEAKLFKTEREIYVLAATHARKENKRFSTESDKTLLETVYRPQARITPTENLDELTDKRKQLILKDPHRTPIEKEVSINEGTTTIGLSHIDGLPVDQAKKLIESRRAPVDVSAEGLLRKFEGFRENAYWYNNAYRVGYGSDTVTRADGTIVPVTKDTKVTGDDAERDLARRSGEFSSVVEK